LEHFWGLDEPRATQTHKIHHSLDLGEATTFPLILYSMPLHEVHIQMAFCPGTPKRESRNCQSWDFRDFGAHNFVCRPPIKMKSKEKCSPCRELSNSMWNATCTQGNRVDFRLLVVGCKIGNLTPDLSFGHNLCFRCPNGWCEPILDIFVSIFFQWYKELFEPFGFDPCNHSLNIQESIGTPTPNMGVHLRVWRFFLSHSFALPGGMRMWFSSLVLIRTLASPFCLGCKPKARVATF
jgi:hypothetical protein